MSGTGEGLVAGASIAFGHEPAGSVFKTTGQHGDGDAIAYLERHARNAAAIEGSEAASADDRDRARLTRQCAERWAQDLRAGMHHGEAEAWAAALAAEQSNEGEC